MRAMFVSAALAALPAHSQEPTYYDGSGIIYVMTSNENGLVLTSKYPVGLLDLDPRQVNPNGTLVPSWSEGPRVLYLGKACDAYSEEFGEGKWSSSSGSAAGFTVEFATPPVVIDFALQEVPSNLTANWTSDCLDRNLN